MRRNYIWGIILILVGVGAVAKQFININLPTRTIIFFAFFILWGISILTGHHTPFERHSHRHRDRDRDRQQDDPFIKNQGTSYGVQEKHDVIFSDTTIDLTALVLPETNKNIKIDTIFARSYVKINPEIPAIIKVTAMFAGAYLPNRTNISFGDYTYTTKGFKEGSPYYYIKADVIFGQMDIVEV